MEAPNTIEEAVEIVVGWLDDDERARIAKMPSDQVYGMNLSFAVRARFSMWQRQCPALMRACRNGDPDGASAVIVRAVANRLAGRPLYERIFFTQRSYPCQGCGGSAWVSGYDEGELYPRVEARCNSCIYRAWTQRERARVPEVAVDPRFEAAALIGNRFGVGLALTKAKDDADRLRVAQRLYAEDHAFRASWNELYNKPPHAGNMEKLRPWRAPNVRIEAGVVILELATGGIRRWDLTREERPLPANAGLQARLYRDAKGTFLVRVASETEVRWYATGKMQELHPHPAPEAEQALQRLD